MAQTTIFTATNPVNPALEEVLDRNGLVSQALPTLFEITNTSGGQFNGFKFRFVSGATAFTYAGTTPTGGTIASATVVDAANNVVASISDIDNYFLNVLWDALQDQGPLFALDGMFFGFDPDSFFGSTSADRLTGHSLGDFLNGGGGNDLLIGRNGAGTLVGGTGDDVFRPDLFGAAAICFDLQEEIWIGKAAQDAQRAAGRVTGKIGLQNTSRLRHIMRITDVDRDLGDVGDLCAAGGKRLGKIFHHHLSLGVEIFVRQHVAVHVRRNLTSAENEFLCPLRCDDVRVV